MTVNPEERAAMARLMQIMEGQTPAPVSTSQRASHNSADPVILAGPGQVTDREINAMADVLRRLEGAVNNTSRDMIQESFRDHQLQEALITEQTSAGVKIGVYTIQQGLDEGRLAGKQFYSVINRATGETLAHELSLYEAAHGLVRLLNNGKFFNSLEVRKLLEAEDGYTSHKIDAVRFHRMMRKAERAGDTDKAQLMETRKQASMDRAMRSKADLKRLYSGI
jgi:hypothetical protein